MPVLETQVGADHGHVDSQPLVRRLFRRPPVPAAVVPPVVVVPSLPLESPWDVILRRCREATKADCVFAVDAGGIVVGRQGTYGRAEVDRVAAHVSRAFDLVDALQEIGSESESISVRYAEGRWLTAVRIRPDEEKVVTVGVVGPYTLITQDRLRLRNAFLKMLGASPDEAAEAA